MWKSVIFSLLLALLVPFLEGMPSGEFVESSLGVACENCRNFDRETRNEGKFDSLAAGGIFGVSKRPKYYRGFAKDEPFEKRRRALDSLVAGGMFGKAKRLEHYEGGEPDFLKNNYETGTTYKRLSLDSLGNNAFGMEKREHEQKSFTFQGGVHPQKHLKGLYLVPVYEDVFLTQQ